MQNIDPLIDKALGDKGAFEIYNFYNNLIKQENKRTKVINLANSLLKIAGVVTLLFLFVRAYYIDSVQYPQLEPYELIAIEFYLDEIPENFRDKGLSETDISMFNNLVKAHNYKAAAELSLKAYEDGKGDGWALYTGHCFMFLGDFESAKKYLGLLHSNPVYAETSNYYALGCHLAKQDYKNASALAATFNKKSYYYNKVQNLLHNYYANHQNN